MEEQEQRFYIPSDVLTLAFKRKGLVARQTLIYRYVTKNKQIHLVAEVCVILDMVDVRLFRVPSSVAKATV